MPKLHDPVMPTPPHAVGTTSLPDGRRMGWASFGDPTGDPVVWFHGTPGGRSQVPSDLDEEARARRLRVIGIERPGTGGREGTDLAELHERVHAHVAVDAARDHGV